MNLAELTSSRAGQLGCKLEHQVEPYSIEGIQLIMQFENDTRVETLFNAKALVAQAMAATKKCCSDAGITGIECAEVMVADAINQAIKALA